MEARVLAGDMEDAIKDALAALESGAVVAMPTDTVYGLAARLDRERAIERLYQVKSREPEKPIPILMADLDALSLVSAEPPEALASLAAAFWPGPLTIVVPKAAWIPLAVSQGPTVGVRVPDHPLALKLLQAAGPLAVTSANLSGEEPCRTAEHIAARLGNRIELILDGGKTPGREASTVVALVEGNLRVLRPGPISRQQLSAALVG